jgi:hypothetical protein
LNKERFCFNSGGYYGLHVVASNYSRGDIACPKAVWELSDGFETYAEGMVESGKRIASGSVEELIYISTRLPEVKKPLSLRLKVSMIYEGGRVENQWPVWVFPDGRYPAPLALYDVTGSFIALGENYAVYPLKDNETPPGGSIVVTNRITPAVESYLRDGGRVFFMQRGDGCLPVKKTAFWREGMVREFPHEILKGLDRNVYDDLKYFSLATDTAIDTFELKEFKAVPVIRRYDCREFEATDYMVELEVGKGRMIATTLRLEGGMGKQPNSMKYSPFACYLFDRAVSYLSGNL